MAITNEEKEAIQKELESDKRDIIELWNSALASYNGIAGYEIKREFANMAAIIEYGNEAMEKFHSFRHNQKKVDKLRTAFKNSMDYIEIGATQLVAAAAPVFPPAVAIGTAFAYMLNAAKQVSAEYDTVTVFFDDMNKFLDRLTILQSRVPREKGYRNCLVDVFTSLLEMCGFATKYIETRRFKTWISNMFNGQDTELDDARSKMDKALLRLQSATEMAILGNTEELRRMTQELAENDREQKLFQESIRVWQEEQRRWQEEQREISLTQTSMITSVAGNQEYQISLIKEAMTLFREGNDAPSKQKAAKMSAQNKSPTSMRVRNWFENTVPPSTEYRKLKDSMIPQTATWIFQEESWKSWSTQSTGLLNVSGPGGSGKSYLAASAYDRLHGQREADSNVVAAYYFRGANDELSSLDNAMCWIVVQVAEQNVTLCEKINAELTNEDEDNTDYGWEDTYRRFLLPLFKGSPTIKLKIILDGIDELSESERSSVIEFLELLKQGDEASQPKISVLCTSRAEYNNLFEPFKPQTLPVDIKKQRADLRALIWARLNNANRLRQLSRHTKLRISSTLEETSNVLVFAEHILRQFDNIGRESVILKELKAGLPTSLEGLYDKMLDDIETRCPDEVKDAMRILFCWLAFAYRPLTLAEATYILKLISATNLEEELEDHFSRVLKIADFEDGEETGNNDDSDAAYDDSDMQLVFQSRSMREFFCDAKDKDGLRTPASRAHRELFLTCANIMCGKVQNVPDKLTRYAADNWLNHLGLTEIDQHSAAELVEVVESLQGLLSNAYDTSGRHQAAGVDYYSLTINFTKQRFKATMTSWMDWTLQNDVPPHVKEWATKLAATPKDIMNPIAMGHVTQWFRARDSSSVRQCYSYAIGAINVASAFKDSKKEAASGSEDADADDSGDGDDDGDGDGDDADGDDDYTPDDDDDGDDDDDSEDEEDLEDRDKILNMSTMFKDISMDAMAHWTVALMLNSKKHFDAALVECQTALDMCNDDTERFQILNLQANIFHGKEDEDKALESITTCLKGRKDTLPGRMVRDALITRGRIETAQEKYIDSAKSYEAARLANPSELMPGVFLREEFDTYTLQEDYPGIVDVVYRWKPAERLVWMTFKYDESDGHHTDFRDAAARVERQDFMVQVYKDAIEVLKESDAAPPMQLQLAWGHWKARHDNEAAKLLLEEILDSSSDGTWYELTEEEPSSVLSSAMNMLSDILYDQFIDSGNPKRKAALLEEMRAVQNRRLVHCISAYKTDVTQYWLNLARMVRKMGPALEFQDILNRIFDNCYEALSDSVGWNDQDNLLWMAQVVSQLDGFTRDARILGSALFSDLDAEDDSEDEEDEDQDDDGGDDDGGEDDDESGNESADGSGSGSDDGSSDSNSSYSDVSEGSDSDDDDDDNTVYYCHGQCMPSVVLDSWDEHALYLCLTCYDCMLCEGCIEKRRMSNAAKKANASNQSAGTSKVYTNDNPTESGDTTANTDDKTVTSGETAANAGDKAADADKSDDKTEADKPPTAGDQTVKDFPYCPPSHRYVKLPIEGWKGIENGTMTIEGEEPIKFIDWLRDLKERKWKAGWERFWKREDGLPDDAA